MSIAEFFKQVMAGVEAIAELKPSQHDLAIKAMTMVAEGAVRQQTRRASKRNLHRGVTEIIDWVKHKGNKLQVAIHYRPVLDGSRFWLTPGKGEAARRQCQIAAGSLRLENGLCV